MMLAHIRTQNKEIGGRMFQFEKFPAMEGIKLGKLLAAKLIPLAESLPAGSLPENGSLGDTMKNLAPGALDAIPMNKISAVLDSIGPADLEGIVKACLTRVSEILPGNTAAVIDERGNYQIADVEYDPVLFVRLVWEELRFGMSDFFKGDRWISLFVTEDPAVSDLFQPTV